MMVSMMLQDPRTVRSADYWAGRVSGCFCDKNKNNSNRIVSNVSIRNGRDSFKLRFNVSRDDARRIYKLFFIILCI